MSDEKFVPCNHARKYGKSYIPSIDDWVVITPASHAGYTSCIRCIRANIDSIDSLPDTERKGIPTSARRSAGLFLTECISQPKDIPTWYKFQALMWCLKWGIKASHEVFDFTFPFSASQLAELSKYGAFPIGDALQRYAKAGLWKEIEAIRLNLPSIYFDCYTGKDESTANYRAYLYKLVYGHKLPDLVRFLLHKKNVLPGEFVPKAIINAFILPFVL